MNLAFTKLTISDFKEFRGTHKLVLSKLGLGVQYVCGINKVEPRLGSNGAGKSSIFDAMSWCLYGRTVGELRNADVKSWGATTTPDVSMTVKIDGDKSVIRRKAVSNGLWIDDKVVVQSAVDELIGLPFELFQHTLIFGQGRPLFLDLTPGPKMAVLSEALQLDKWEQRAKAARDKANGYSFEANSLATKIENLTATKADVLAEIKKLNEQSRDFEHRRSSAADRHEREVTKLTKVVEAAEKEWGIHDLAYDGAETELRHAKKKHVEMATEFTNYVQAFKSAQLEAEHVSRRMREIKQTIGSLGAGDKCPTCGQSLRGTALARHHTEQKQYLTQLAKELSRANKKTDVARASSDKRQDELTATSKTIARFTDKSNDAIDARTRAESKLANAKAELKAAKRQIAEIDQQPDPYAELLTTARQRLKTIKSDIKELSKAHNIKLRNYERAKYWVDGFRNVRLKLVDEVLQELQAITQTMLAEVGLDGWQINYAMERETKSGKISTGLNVSIFKPGMKSPVKWDAWSGGERQRLRLIGAAALSETLLRHVNVTCDVLILDEPTQHLSVEGVRDTCAFLIDRGRDHQVFYVDHQAIDNTRFAHTIMVTRDKAGARLDIQ